MTENELKVLLEAAQSLKLNPAELKARNPFTMEGKVAESLQLAVQALDPMQAAQWAQEAGRGASLEAAAALAGVIPMSQAAHQNLMETSPEYVEQHKAAQEKAEAELLAKWDAEAKAMANARGHDADAPRPATNWRERWQQEQQEHQRLMQAAMQQVKR
jgi:hypothetical protein